MEQDKNQQEVQCHQISSVGYIELDRPKALNALSINMIRSMVKTLKNWEKDEGVTCVVIMSKNEKAFCSGGDVRMMRTSLMDNQNDHKIFIQEEYQLDYLIHKFSKPIICCSHGITMGGGWGVYAGASHRLVSETSLFSMPEIFIGFFPDVGSSWFLMNHFPELGLILAVTGGKLNGHQALAAGYAHHQVNSIQRSALFNSLERLKWSKDSSEHANQISETIKRHEDVVSLSESYKELGGNSLKVCFESSNLLAYEEALSKEAEYLPWIKASRSNSFNGSALSRYITFDYFKHHAAVSIEDSFEKDLKLAEYFFEQSDFCEGIRAVLVDKTADPKWRYTEDEKIKQMVKEYN